MKKHLLVLPVLSIGMMSAPALAAPLSPATGSTAATSGVQKVQAFHRDCAWVDNKWTYRRGDKVVVCRPMRPPGRGWIWHRGGNRYGWYHSGRKAWYSDRW